MKTKFPLSLNKTTEYLLALSGGADSVCLFHLLIENGIPFAAAHVNHGIRGPEADRDEEFCRALSEKHGVEFHSLRADVPAIASERGESLEEAARNVRYSFFEQVMREREIPVLLTAHNADDNAETLILALTRGASPSGACGIPRERELAYGSVIRPILHLTKAEITEYCRENSLEFVTDATNSDIGYPRNRIRSRVLPELAQINPRVLAAAARFTETQRADSEYLDSLAREHIASRGADRASLVSLPHPIASRVLNISACAVGARPETLHVKMMLDAVKEGAGSLTLPGGVSFTVSGDRFAFSPECREPKADRAVYPDIEPIALREGENRFGEGNITLVFGELTNDFAQVYNLSISAHINLDRIKGQLTATPRREGDRMVIRSSHRSVKKLISDTLRGLPLDQRRALPVIRDGEEIVWIPGLPVADEYRADPNARVLTLNYCI